MRADVPGSWSPWTERAWPPGWTVCRVEETASTNDDVIAAAADGRLEGRVALVAAHQTAGRGRLGRRWDAPPKSNLLVSLHLPDTDGESHSPAVAVRRVALAALAAVDRALADAPRARTELGEQPSAGLKWPNDILLGERKLAGILARRTGAVASTVVGIGLNLGWAPDGAVRLADHSVTTVSEVLAGLLEAYDELPADTSLPYRARLVTIGQDVRVELPSDRRVVGRAVDVDDDGRLIVEDADRVRHRFDAGDVIHLRRAD